MIREIASTVIISSVAFTYPAQASTTDSTRDMTVGPATTTAPSDNDWSAYSKPGTPSLAGGIICAQVVAGTSGKCISSASIWYSPVSRGLGSGTQFTTSATVGQMLKTVAVPVFTTNFLGAGAGQGKPIRNNAAAATNHTNASWSTLGVYYSPYYQGPVDWIPGGQTRDLVKNRNNNASMQMAANA